MNEVFLQLPREKQLAIYNASMEVFGEYEYKRASTDLIAVKAGISKGLLFYYFHNKKSLYMHTFDYVSEMIRESVCDSHLAEITDFFEFVEYAKKKKVQRLNETPYITQFALRSFYSKNEVVSDELQANIAGAIEETFQTYFRNMEWHKFKEGIDPKQILNMMVWMTDGYMHTRQIEGKPIVVDDVSSAFEEWAVLFKKIAYKEEYQ